MPSRSAPKRWHNRRAPVSGDDENGHRQPFANLYKEDGSIRTVHNETIKAAELDMLCNTYVGIHFRAHEGNLIPIKTGRNPKTRKIKQHALYFLHAYNTVRAASFVPKTMTQPWKDSVRAWTGATMSNKSTFQLRDWIDGRHQHPFIIAEACTSQTNPKAKVGRYLKVRLCDQLVQAMDRALGKQ